MSPLARGPDTQDAGVVMTGVTKWFGTVGALRDVDLALRNRRVHALIGENGAGKSTLMNVLTGVYRADAGRIGFAGEPVDMRSPAKPASSASAWCTSTSSSSRRSPASRTSRSRSRRTRPAAAGRRPPARRRPDGPLRADGRPRCRVADLEVGDQQKVELLRVLAQGARVLLLDEPRPTSPRPRSIACSRPCASWRPTAWPSS